MKRLLILLVIMVVGMVMITVNYSLAQNVPPPKPECQERFKATDTDEDGAISLDEFMEAQQGDETDVRAMFDEKDTDGDGQLSIEEFCAIKK